MKNKHLPFALTSMAAVAFVLGFSGCTRNALLELTVNMPTQEEGTFTVEGMAEPVTPRFGMIIVGAGEPDEPNWAEVLQTYEFNEEGGIRKIPLDDATANPRDISVLADDGFERPVWVLVRLCRDEADCSGRAPVGPTRDHIWVLERAFYKTKVTRAILPITDSTDAPRDPPPYGCIQDEWAARSALNITTPVMIDPCFVAGCVTRSGDETLGCGSQLNYDCEFPAGAPLRHDCEDDQP